MQLGGRGHKNLVDVLELLPEKGLSCPCRYFG